MIELKRNPLGAPSRQVRGVVPTKVSRDATSLADKLRIANKVSLIVIMEWCSLLLARIMHKAL